MAKIENIVFDMGGVLMTWEPERFAHEFAENDEDAQLLYQALFGRTEWALLDSGTIDHATMRRVARAACPERLWDALDALTDGWPKCSQVIEPMNELGIRLHNEGYRLWVLSNASDRIDAQLGHAPVYSLLSGRVVSAMERLMKPNSAIFTLFCERFGVEPASCLFIDDSANNCEGARVAGMYAFQHTGEPGHDAAACEAYLRELEAEG